MTVDLVPEYAVLAQSVPLHRLVSCLYEITFRAYLQDIRLVCTKDTLGSSLLIMQLPQLAYTRIVYRPVSAISCGDTSNASRSPVRKSRKVSIPLQSMPRSTIVTATASRMPVTMVRAPFNRAA
jgi:hypothetical protein